MCNYVSKVNKHIDEALDYFDFVKQEIEKDIEKSGLTKNSNFKIAFEPFEKIIAKYHVDKLPQYSKTIGKIHVGKPSDEHRVTITPHATREVLITKHGELFYEYELELTKYISENEDKPVKLLELYKCQKIMEIYVHMKELYTIGDCSKSQIIKTISKRVSRFNILQKNIQYITENKGKNLFVETDSVNGHWKHFSFNGNHSEIEVDKKLLMHATPNSFISIGSIVDLEVGFKNLMPTGSFVE